MDLALEFTLQIARQALEQTLLSELEEKDGTLFTGADATLEFCALGEKEEFYSFLPKATFFPKLFPPKERRGRLCYSLVLKKFSLTEYKHDSRQGLAIMK